MHKCMIRVSKDTKTFLSTNSTITDNGIPKPVRAMAEAMKLMMHAGELNNVSISLTTHNQCYNSYHNLATEVLIVTLKNFIES